MFNISVTESGERLYIHPIAVDEGKVNSHKIIYLHGREFPFYKNDQILQNSWYTQILNRKKKFYHLYLKRFFLTCKSVISDTLYYRDRIPLKLFWHYYNVYTVPVFAYDAFDGYITVYHQLSLHDPDNWTDGVYYLNPSQKYLNKRMEEWLNSTELYDGEVQKEFLEWKDDQESLGLKVIYLCSLDT